MRLLCIVALASLLASGCAEGSAEGPGETRGRAGSPATESATPEEPQESNAADVDGVRVVLSSHCGVRSIRVKGRLWLATPPLGDHNPPPGWGENDTPGMFVVVAPRRAQFQGDGGQSARFRLARPGTPDPGEGCE